MNNQHDSGSHPSDPFGIVGSLNKICRYWSSNHDEWTALLDELNRYVQTVVTHELSRFSFENRSSTLTDDGKNLFQFLQTYSEVAEKSHSAYTRWLYHIVDRALEREGEVERQSSRFWAKQLVQASSPANYFWTNFAAVRRWHETGGESLTKGLSNLRRDVARGDSLPRITAPDAFRVGRDLANTPGFVVFRNELIELLQYNPTTKTVRSIPIVLVPPWVNKYYILDLSGQKSLARYLVSNGFTVFAISWRNPTAAMRDISFADYVFRGALKAVDVAKHISGSSEIHAVGHCIGGTCLATLMAWLNKELGTGAACPVAHWTLLATLVDFSDPGELGVYIRGDTIETVEELMRRDGYLDGKYVELAFRSLRADELIWRYFARNYLLGEQPLRHDILFWNSDTTRLPQSMCSFYLRELYLENKLVEPNRLVMGRHPIDLGCIAQPLYAVGAVQDHIAPWQGTFRTCELVAGPVRYVLASEGHIAGIVNPPSLRSGKQHWVGDVEAGDDAERWISDRPAHRGSWWVDWVSWLSDLCGPLVESPTMGCDTYPPLDEAPGLYVMER